VDSQNVELYDGRNSANEMQDSVRGRVIPGKNYGTLK
jgi:hypothetical protein